MSKTKGKGGLRFVVSLVIAGVIIYICGWVLLPVVLGWFVPH